MFEIIKAWFEFAGIVGFVCFIGFALLRLLTGERTRFGEIVSHWDFKNGFFMVVSLPFIVVSTLWRAIRGKSLNTTHETQLPLPPVSPPHGLKAFPPAAASLPTCPKCGEIMRRRTGKFGVFWGCSRYPKCKGTRNV